MKMTAALISGRYGTTRRSSSYVIVSDRRPEGFELADLLIERGQLTDARHEKTRAACSRDHEDQQGEVEPPPVPDGGRQRRTRRSNHADQPVQRVWRCGSQRLLIPHVKTRRTLMLFRRSRSRRARRRPRCRVRAMVPRTLRGCALSPSSHSFSWYPFPASAQTHTFGGVGTRAEGMGGAFVAVADDASAVYWNPAGIATGATFDAPDSRTGRDSTFFVGAALPVLGASYYRTSQAAGFTTVSAPVDRQNGGSGEVHMGIFTTSNFGATVVQTIVPAVVIGTTVRAVSAEIDGADLGTTVDFDAGAIVSVWNMRFGVTGRNLIEPEFEMEGELSEWRVRSGSAPRSSHGRCRRECMGPFRSHWTRISRVRPAQDRRAAPSGRRRRVLASERPGWRSRRHSLEHVEARRTRRSPGVSPSGCHARCT